MPARELAELRKISTIDWLVDYRVTFSINAAKGIIDIAKVVLSCEVQAKHGHYDEAIAESHRGVLLEDNLIYNEPLEWLVPVRQVLGSVLIEAGRPEEAEAIKTRFDNAWSKADIVLTVSRIVPDSARSSSKVAGK